MATSKSRRGFAAMSKEKRQAIARQGGKASHGGGRKSSNPRSKSR
jgi:general stress protein YciG